MQLVTLHLTINISTKDPRVALDQADEAINRIIPIDPSKTLEKAVTKVKWVMDVLAPIAEVSVIAVRCTRRANLHTQLSPFAKMAHGLLLAIPKARPFASFSERDAHTIFLWVVDRLGTVWT
jgi:hypothetical protein